MDVNGIVQAMNIKNGNIRFNINPSNLIHVGDAPEMKGLPGCIHDITFNGRKLGLWKFEKSGQCEGCSMLVFFYIYIWTVVYQQIICDNLDVMWPCLSEESWQNI